MQSEDEMSIQEEMRVPLTEEMKIFLRQCPWVLIPTLNIKEVSKVENCIESKKPRLSTAKLSESTALNSIENSEENAHDEGQSTEANALASTNNKLQPASPSGKLPESPRSQSQEKYDEPGPSSSSVSDAQSPDDKSPGTPMQGIDACEDDPSEQLVRRPTTTRRVQDVNETQLPRQLRNKLTVRRGQVVSYFMSNPLPISSTLGRKIIRSGLGRCRNPADQVARYERYCTTPKQRSEPAGVTHWPVVNTGRAEFRAGQYCHKYTFGTRQRLARNVELTLGLSTKSFPLLNKCRDFSIHLHKMSDQDVAQAMYSLQNPPEAQDSGEATPEPPRPVVRRWVASEPTAGPSEDIERIAEPVVLLDNICLPPEYARYFY